MRIIHSLFIIFLFTSGGFAQVSIDITVINRATNQPVSDVLVGIRNQAIGFTQSAFSNSQGKVLFEGLSTSGAYDVFITENVEWKGIIAEKLVLTANKNKKCDASHRSEQYAATG